MRTRNVGVFSAFKSRIVSHLLYVKDRLLKTPGVFSGTRQNNTPVVTESETHWVVQKLEAKVSLGVLHKELLETLQFKVKDLNKPHSPWNDFTYWTWLESANYSMETTNPLADTESLTFGLNKYCTVKL